MMTPRLRLLLRATLCCGAIALAALTQACAEKGLLVPNNGTTKFEMQVTIMADQQSGFGPRFVLAGAGFDGQGDDEGAFLGYAFAPYAPGTQVLRVPVDISTCLAYWARKGRQTCPLLIGAALVEDTMAVHDTTGGGDPFAEVFDVFFDGPFFIGAGGALPTVRAIDLSASRFAVVKWEGDDALRVGGNLTPSYIGALAGVPGAGSSPAVLFAASFGQDYSDPEQSRGPYPAIAVQQNGVWKRYVATTAPTGTQVFTDITALSATEAYAAHSSGLYAFNGSSVTKVSAVTDVPVSVGSVVTAAGPKLVIAGASGGAVWINNGQTWQRSTVPGSTPSLSSVCINAANEAFAAVQNGGSTYRYDGTAWTSVPVPGNGSGKVNLQCTGPGQAFVTAQNGQRYSWNGSTWVALTNTGLGSNRSYVLSVVSPSEMYMAGDSSNVDRAFYRLNGTAWQEVSRKRFTGSLAQKPWADPRGGAYFASNQFGRVERATGSGVTVVSFAPTMRDVSMSSLNNAVVVGNNAFLARWNGTRWSVDAPPGGVSANRNLRGVWTDGPSNAWAAGQSGALFHFDGSSWTAKGVPSTDNLNAVWGAGSDVWVVGDASMLFCKAPNACVTQPTGGSGALYSVWGTSATNVFAVGAGGRIIQFRNGTWSSMTSPTTRPLYRVAGTGPNDVWALGDGVLLRYNGTDWKPAPDPHGDLADAFGQRAPFNFPGAPDNMAFWARTTTEAYFSTLTNHVHRFSDGLFSQMGLGGYRHNVMGIAGLATGCALAVTETFTDPPSPTLYRGIGPSGCFLSPMTGPASWP